MELIHNSVANTNFDTDLMNSKMYFMYELYAVELISVFHVIYLKLFPSNKDMNQIDLLLFVIL